MTRVHPSAGFTLIELMIAISLSAVILLTVTSGFRVASQSVTAVSRLATENQLMRLGCQVAHDRLDYWTDFDDPDNVNNQNLRSKDMNGGLPFTPMNLAAPYSPNGSAELATGWNSSEHWSEADPRVWWHGNVAEKCNSNVLCGRYSIFGNTSQTLTVTTNNLTIGSYGQVSVVHCWRYNQIWSLHNALGYYGCFDYMPANTLYEAYQPYNSGQTNDDGEALLLDTPGGAFASTEGPQYYPHGLYRLSMGTAIGLTVPAAFNVTGTQPGAGSHGLTSPANGPSMNRSIYFQQYYYLDYQANLPTMQQFNMDTTSTAQLIPGSGPSTWPNVQVSVQRFIKTNRFVNVCRVVCRSPLSGQVTQLVWDGTGSSLRGARLQRTYKPINNSSWAVWDDDPAQVANNSPTLDDP
jgi:prepilin-type N-terminal cleavage/methylation domain-containing protein